MYMTVRLTSDIATIDRQREKKAGQGEEGGLKHALGINLRAPDKKYTYYRHPSPADSTDP